MKKSKLFLSGILAMSLLTSSVVAFAEETAPTTEESASTDAGSTAPTTEESTSTDAEHQYEGAKNKFEKIQQRKQEQMEKFKQHKQEQLEAWQQKKQAQLEMWKQKRQAHIEKVKQLMQEGDLEEAIEAQKEVLENEYKDPSQLKMLGQLYKKEGMKGIKAFINGKMPNFDVPPVIKNGRTLVPIRAISESLGAEVKYDQTTRTITIVKGDTTIVLPLGMDTATVNGETVKLDSPALLMNNRTLVPIRFVSEALKAKVNWESEGQVISIEDEAQEPEDTVVDEQQPVNEEGAVDEQQTADDSATEQESEVADQENTNVEPSTGTEAPVQS